jgi:SAM-dependent methyltransferase
MDITVALQELRRVLKPGGTLILTMDNKGNLTEPLFRLWISLGFAPFFSGKTYSIKELKRVLEEIDFDVKATASIIHNPRLITRKIVNFLRWLDARKLDPWIRKGLAFLDRLENKRIKYLTGLYIAVKAMKPEEYEHAHKRCR